MSPKTAKAPTLALGNLTYLILYAQDVLKSVAYYRDTLGMKVKGEVNEFWTELDAGACTLALHKAEKPLSPSAEGPTPVFHVADVRAAHAALKTLGVKPSDLHQVCEMGEQVGLSSDFRDPDGNRLSVFGLVKKGS